MKNYPSMIEDKIVLLFLLLLLFSSCKTEYTQGTFGHDIKLLQEFSFTGESDYVNSRWIEQKDPYAGDVINVFNNGPRESGEPFGPFYELETSSHAKELRKGESLTHRHTTFHFEGDKNSLNKISKETLAVDLDEIETMFTP